MEFEKFDSLWEFKQVKQSELSEKEADMNYVGLVMEHVVGQFDMDQDIVYYLNPEKYIKPKQEIIEPAVPHVTHGVQAVFHPFSSFTK